MQMATIFVAAEAPNAKRVPRCYIRCELNLLLTFRRR
jgi:hypothetical protein